MVGPLLDGGTRKSKLPACKSAWTYLSRKNILTVKSKIHLASHFLRSTVSASNALFTEDSAAWRIHHASEAPVPPDGGARIPQPEVGSSVDELGLDGAGRARVRTRQ